MTRILSFQSSLTDRYQTTVPEHIRQVLGLGKRDKVDYQVTPDGEVKIARAPRDERDPAIVAFLGFIEADLQRGRAQEINQSLASRMDSLVGGIDVNLDEPLLADDD